MKGAYLCERLFTTIAAQYAFGWSLTKHMKIPAAALMFVIVAFTDALSCTCTGAYQAHTMREVAEWYANRPDTELIFEGTVVSQTIHRGSVGAPATAMSMTRSEKYRNVEFTTNRVFRGAVGKNITVLTGFGGGDCGYDFRTGRSYLVYASSGRQGDWFTSICSGTAALEDAGAAMRFLAGEKPTSEDLLSPSEFEKHYSKDILPKRTGTVCGWVLKPDGTPLKGADVELWEPREDEFPSLSFADENTSTADGHFCIKNAEPGGYLLTVESIDYNHDARYLSFFPGVLSRVEAVPLYIEAGVRLPDVRVSTFREPLYTIRIRVVAADGSQLSYKNGCGVAVDSTYRDPLSYHLSHTLKEDGTYTFGFIPSGKYVVQTFFQPNFDDGEPKPFPEGSKYQPALQEVTVRGDTDVVIRMQPNKAK